MARPAFVLLLVLSTVLAVSGAPAPACRKGMLAFNAGGPSIPTLGFAADNPAYLVGAESEVYSTNANITIPPKCTMGVLYQTERFTRGPRLVYRVPVPSGVYVVTTFHAETYFDAPGKRMFHIEINGARMRTNLDVFKDANGMNKGIKLKHHNIRSINGTVEIAFIKSTQNPQVNAIRFQGAAATAPCEMTEPPTSNTATEAVTVPMTNDMGTTMDAQQSQMVAPEPTASPMSMGLESPSMEPPSMSPEPSGAPMSMPSPADQVAPTAIPVVMVPSPSSQPSSSAQAPTMAPTPTSTAMPTPTPAPSSSPTPTKTLTPVAMAAAPSPPPMSTTSAIQSNPSAGTARTPKKGKPGCAGGNYIFCEDFEGAPGAREWTLKDDAKVALAPARNGKQSKALYLNPVGGQQGSMIAKLQGAAGPELYGRIHVYVKQFATKPPFAHFIIAELSEANSRGDPVPETEQIRPVGGQYALNQTQEASVWGVGSFGGKTGDWTQWRSSAPTEDAKWTCVQWSMKRSNSQIDVWIDGKFKPELTVNKNQHTGGHGEFLFPQFNKAWFGWWVFQGDTTPTKFDVYIDDIALATKPIEC